MLINFSAAIPLFSKAVVQHTVSALTAVSLFSKAFVDAFLLRARVELFSRMPIAEASAKCGL